MSSQPKYSSHSLLAYKYNLSKRHVAKQIILFPMVSGHFTEGCFAETHFAKAIRRRMFRRRDVLPKRRFAEETFRRSYFAE
uniref:Uncharacterized protein n=1 Tax=Rhizophagus irregularis (strain DAOM 181602 / DAOM 197198 / MUCL 43194) TaxID=747089 RepID=U9UAC2_RHIID